MRSDLVKSYWAAMYFNGRIFTKNYHGLLSRLSIISAYKNKMIEDVLPPYEANSREEAEVIARSVFALRGQIK